MDEQTCTRGETISSLVTETVGRPLRDPFGSQLVIVPGPGHARWLSQQVATHWGITAGVEFLTFGQLRHRLARRLDVVSADDDAWAVPPLTLTLVGLLADLRATATSPDWAKVLAEHLRPDRPGRLWSTANRVARLFHRYARRAPKMIDAWTHGDPVGPRGAPLSDLDRWQFELLRGCLDRIGSGHPRAGSDRLLAAIPGLTSPWERVTVAWFGTLLDDDRALAEALSGVVELRCVRLVPPDGDDPTGDSFAASPGDSVLQRFQAHLAHGAGPSGSDDPSVQVLRSHGLSRQVEVLREALCGVFEDDPTLEPRDAVIICPDLRTAAPLLEASFGRRVDEQSHPGHRLRVQVPPPQGSAGPVHEVLALLFDLVIGRATAEDLNTLVSLPAVSAKFDFSPDDHARIRELVDKAGLRWGLDAGTRAEHGLPGVPQGVWLNAVERMVTGGTYADSPLTWLGTALPIPHVESGDLRLIGQVAELVSRVRWLDKEFRTPATPVVWADRLRLAIDRFVHLEWQDQWAVTATVAAIGQWADGADDSSTLDQDDVRQVVADLARSWRSRPAYGNGSIQVVGLDDLVGIPHRVVAILGLDDGSFPRRRSALGDDLLNADDHPDHDPRVQSQLGLKHALLSARDRLLVVHQGNDPRTGAVIEPPVAITQISAALRAVSPGFRMRSMPLQPHSPVNFLSDPTLDEVPFSFDEQALAAARALAQSAQNPSDPPEDPRLWRFPSAPGGAVALADVVAFWRHPARAMLRHAIGTSLARDGRTRSQQVPLELYGLSEFAVGQAALDHLMAGATIDQATMAARLGGEVPPGSLGEQALTKTIADAAQLADLATQNTGAERDHAISLDLGRWQLSGVVRCSDDVVLSVTYAKQSGVSLMTTWLNLLAVSVELDTPMRARSLHLDSRHLVLQAPSPARCRDLLVDLLDWRGLGLESVLLAPLKLLHLVELRALDQPSDERTKLEGRISREFNTLGRDADWQGFLPPTLTGLLATPAHASSPVTVAQLGGRLFSPITKAMVLS